MKVSDFLNADLSTPCYVYDQAIILDVLDKINALTSRVDIKTLYSIKAANNIRLLEFIRPYVSGFSCSSLYELMLADEILEQGQSRHLTTPIYKDYEWQTIQTLANYVSINSISQWQRFSKNNLISAGLRINPEQSFARDIRYDPCRVDSKLGVNRNQLVQAFNDSMVSVDKIEGIHLHNNCESTDFGQLQQSVNIVLTILDEFSIKPRWLNLGGGYLFHNSNCDELITIVNEIRTRFDVDIFIEPGKAIVGHAGYIVSRVVDIINGENKKIAILDTTINHLPEVFEYQYRPNILNSQNDNGHEYRLAGCSCLSGDLFGDYYFAEPLNRGDVVVFNSVGAYMQVKANWFNGINMPATYLTDENKHFELIMQYDYADFRKR